MTMTNKARKAFALSLQGLKPEEIGDRLGIGKGHARVLVVKGERIASAEASLQSNPDHVRSLTLTGRLPVRIATILTIEGVDTLGQLAGYGERTLTRIPGLGRNGLAILKEILQQRGVSLSGDPNADPGRERRIARWKHHWRNSSHQL